MRLIRVIMKSINVTLTDKAHKNLKALTELSKKNQHDMMSEILENINISKYQIK